MKNSVDYTVKNSFDEFWVLTVTDIVYFIRKSTDCNILYTMYTQLLFPIYYYVVPRTLTMTQSYIIYIIMHSNNPRRYTDIQINAAITHYVVIQKKFIKRVEMLDVIFITLYYTYYNLYVTVTNPECEG